MRGRADACLATRLQPRRPGRACRGAQNKQRVCRRRRACSWRETVAAPSLLLHALCEVEVVRPRGRRGLTSRTCNRRATPRPPTNAPTPYDRNDKSPTCAGGKRQRLTQGNTAAASALEAEARAEPGRVPPRNELSYLGPRLGRYRVGKGSDYRADVAPSGVIQQPAGGDWRGCIEAPTVVGADDRFRRAAGFRMATALATFRSRRLSRRGMSRMIAFASAGAPAAL